MADHAVVLPSDWPAGRVLEDLAARQAVVIFAGLPGVGKSLLLQQVAHLARAAGREVHLLQWDVARRAFETDAILTRYPEVDGFTHAAIKRAAGVWARTAVWQWRLTHDARTSLLLAEAPLVGGRLVELAAPAPDEAEALLASDEVRFVLPVPSREIRQLIEAARLKSHHAPAHERERGDAPPNVLQALWEDVYREGQAAGIVPPSPPGDDLLYDPDAYRAVYASWLADRHLTVLEIDRPLVAAGSVYDIGTVTGELVPSPAEVEQVMGIVEGEGGGTKGTRA